MAAADPPAARRLEVPAGGTHAVLRLAAMRPLAGAFAPPPGIPMDEPVGLAWGEDAAPACRSAKCRRHPQLAGRPA